jgi:hypothetical protein
VSFNGAGVFNRLYSWVVDAANNVNISSSRMDAELNGMAAGLSNCVTRDGQSPPSADIPWGGKKITNLGLATTSTDALSQAAGDARYILSSATSVALAGSLSITTTLSVGGNATVTGSLTANGGATVNGVGGGNAFVIADPTNTSAGVNVQLVGNGATNPNKYFRVFGGLLQIMNSAYSASIFQLDDSGNATFYGACVGLTATIGDNSTKFATTAFVANAITNALSPYAPLNSPALTGVPTAPTAAGGTNTTQVATTAFVQSAIGLSIQNVTSAATVTPVGTNDQVNITAQAVGLTIANPSSTPVDGWGIVIRIKDNGTPQTIVFGTQYRAVGTTLPTTTVAGKTLYVACVWNNADSKLDVVSVAQQ